jgi:hypothetical protein
MGGCPYPSSRRLNWILWRYFQGTDHLCASTRSFVGSSVSLRADLGQSQPGSSNLFAWDVWRQSAIVESAALEILPAPLSMPLETNPDAPLWARRIIAKGGRTDRWPQITATPPRKVLQKGMIVTHGNIPICILRIPANRRAAPCKSCHSPVSALAQSRSDRPNPGRR